MNKLLIPILLLAIQGIKAQDVLFSQYNLAPLTINPALAGHFDGKYRANVLYRSQWANVGTTGAYTTPSASVDANLFDDVVRGSFGAGLNIVNDQAAGGRFNTLNANAVAAYHFAIDPEEKKHFFSVGAQGGIINQSINMTDVTFASQFNGIDKIDARNNSGETLDKNSITIPDLSVGAAFASYFGASNVRVGAAYKHLLGSSQNFYATSAINNTSAIVAHAELNYALGSFLSLHPSVLYAQQTKVTTLQPQLQVGMHFNPTTAVYFGAGMRSGDAFVGMLRVQTGGLQIGLAYDVNNSALQTATRGQGAWEIGITFQGGSSSGVKGSPALKVKPIIPPVRYY